MKKESNHIHYSPEDIRKYLAGELSDPEMQAMEKAALEDPFLADAMEGMKEAGNHPVSFESAVADLQEKLAERIREKKSKPAVILFFSGWKVAASLLFVLGLTFFMYTYIIRRVPREIATTIEKDTVQKSTESVAEPVQSGGQSISSDSGVPPPVQEATGAGNKKIVRKEQAVASRGQETPAAEDKKAELPAPSAETESSAKSKAETSESYAPVQQNKEYTAKPKSVAEELKDQVSGLAITTNADRHENYIQGLVIDQKGKPIPFAPVFSKSERKRTYTDTAGFFRLYMKDPRLAALVYIRPPGYEPVSAELKPDSTVTHTIQMESKSVAMNEVVSLSLKQAKGKSKSAGFFETDSLHMISNLYGWNAFTQYINSHKKITTADSLLKGEEIISFLVDSKGKLSSLQVEQSISPAHDAEAMQLIRSAPILKTVNGKKQRCRITILF